MRRQHWSRHRHSKMHQVERRLPFDQRRLPEAAYEVLGERHRKTANDPVQKSPDSNTVQSELVRLLRSAANLAVACGHREGECAAREQSLGERTVPSPQGPTFVKLHER